MKIGVMGAMTEEIDSIYSYMKDIETVKHGDRIYHIGKINNHDVVLVFSRWGKVASAATVTSLITEFKVEKIIFTGVAGASSSELNIGDIVISEQLYQHDMDARPLMPRYQIPLTNHTFLKADPILVKKAQDAVIKLFSSLSEKIPDYILNEFGIHNPKYFIGTIATGDQFIYTKEKTNLIMTEKPETLAVEMEGAAVAQVCTDYSIPFVVIRTISDKADHSSELDFPKFINMVSRHYSEHIIYYMLIT